MIEVLKIEAYVPAEHRRQDVDYGLVRPDKPASIGSLTTVRGLAACWVVAHHFQGDLFSLFPITHKLKPLLFWGNLAVPLFFILSGFVLSYNYANQFTTLKQARFRKFIFLRLARIYPVHLATLLAVLLMVCACRYLKMQIDEHGYSGRDFLLNMLLAHTWVPKFRLNWNYPSWSISSEWFAYLWFPVVCVMVNRLSTKSAIIALTVVCYLTMQAHLWLGSRLPFRDLLAVVGTFLTGCAIAKMVQTGLRPHRLNRHLPDWLVVLICFMPCLLHGLSLLVVMLTLFSALIYALGSGSVQSSEC
jgi:peptidoglycan/LPS O-acetylase OafA/YrhL